MAFTGVGGPERGVRCIGLIGGMESAASSPVIRNGMFRGTSSPSMVSLACTNGVETIEQTAAPGGPRAAA